MPTGHVKTYRGSYGFLVAEDGHEVFVSGDHLKDADSLRPGDEVEFEVVEDDGRTAARSVAVVKRAPEGNPVGRTMSAPPSWDQLEEIDRQRRAARRRRR